MRPLPPAGCAGAWGTCDFECGRGSSFNTLVGDGNVVFEPYSDRDFGFGQWLSFDYLQLVEMHFGVLRLPITRLSLICRHLQRSLLVRLSYPTTDTSPRSCRTSRRLFLSPSWPGGLALRQLRPASLQQPPFPPTSPAPVTHPGFRMPRAQNPTSDSRRPCSLPSVRETGYARTCPQ